MRAEERPVESRNAKYCGDISKHCAKDSQQMHYSFCAYQTEDGTLVSCSQLHQCLSERVKLHLSVVMCLCVCVLCVSHEWCVLYRCGMCRKWCVCPGVVCCTGVVCEWCVCPGVVCCTGVVCEWCVCPGVVCCTGVACEWCVSRCSVLYRCGM